MSPAGSRPMSWLTAVFIGAVLIVLVLVPLILNYRASAILTRLTEQADPADKMSSNIQAALSREITAIAGFQATGEARYVQLYNEQSNRLREDIQELDGLSAALGPAVQTRIADVRDTIENWYQNIEKGGLAAEQLPDSRFRHLFFQQEHLLDEAHRAASQFRAAVVEYRIQQRSVMRRLARLSVISSMLFAAFALVTVLFVARILQRLRTTTSHLAVRAREEESLRYVAHTLTGAFTLEQVLPRITETAAVAGRADSIYVELVNPEQNEITCVAGHGSGVPPQGTKGSFKGSLAEQVLAKGEPRIIHDVSVEKERRSVFGELAQTCGSCTAMVVPLLAEARQLGALFLLRSHPRKFDVTEIPQVKILADMASLAIERALTLERVRKMQTDARFLSDAAEILSSSLDYSTTLKSVVRLAVPQFADWCVVDLAENGKLQPAEIAHADQNKLTIAQTLRQKYMPSPEFPFGAIRVMQTKRAELFPEITDEWLRDNARDPEHYELLRRLNVRSIMVVPLTVGDQFLGTLTFASEQTRRYGPDSMSFAMDVARHMASAIQNARLYAAAERAVQARDEAISARDEVLRVVSHDLRNPLGNILMSAKMLEAPSIPDDKRRSLLQVIHRAAVRMNRLIDDLMAVARLREGREIPFNVQSENPLEIMEEACDVFTANARAKSIDLRCDRSGPVPVIKADRHRVLQVLSNLLDNAIKFTPQGGRVTVTCRPYEDKVRFTVSDTGRGIEHEHLGKIFDLFWQARPTAHMGAGFGLAIAKRIVEQHGGRIWAESKPGVGTTFFFTLPRSAGTQEDEPVDQIAG